MYNFLIHRDTFYAITEWLKILEQYDDRYLRETIAGFKSRRIQVQALSNPKTQPNQETVLAYLKIDENNQIRALLANRRDNQTVKIDKTMADLHAIELQIFIEQGPLKVNFEDELENLYDTITDFVDPDDEDNLIDYFK